MVDVVCISQSVADAMEPAAVGRLAPQAAESLGLTLTLLIRAGNLAQLLPVRSRTLSPIPSIEVTDYHFGTPDLGVWVRPVDDQGRALATSLRREDLADVTAVSMRGVALSITSCAEEAKTA